MVVRREVLWLPLLFSQALSIAVVIAAGSSLVYILLGILKANDSDETADEPPQAVILNESEEPKHP